MTPRTHDVALVTGGARGLGRAITLELASQGVRVGIVDAAPGDVDTVPYALASDIDHAAVRDEIEALGTRCTVRTADVRDQAELRDAVDEIEGELGPISMLVAAAGVGSVADAGELTDAAWDHVVDTNLHGFYNVARVVVPGLVARGGGRVLAVVGDEGRRGTAGMSHVAAASWAVVGLAKSIALEVAAAGVTVNVVCAGPVLSAFTSTDEFAANVLRGTDVTSIDEALALRHPNDRAWVDPRDVVAAACFLLRAGGTAMTGSVLDVTNGLSALNSA